MGKNTMEIELRHVTLNVSGLARQAGLSAAVADSREVLVFASLVIDSVVRAINAQRVSAEPKEVGLEN